MPGKLLIKVSSIIFIIEGIVGLATYLFGGLLLGAGTVDSGIAAGWVLVAICLVFTVASICELIAGVKGVKGCDKRDAVAELKKWGTIVVIFNVISSGWLVILNIFSGQESPAAAIIGFIISFLFPVLYLIGVNKNKNA